MTRGGDGGLVGRADEVHVAITRAWATRWEWTSPLQNGRPSRRQGTPGSIWQAGQQAVL
ncbi:hypothetical protein ACFU99_14240 [Streptomyces sp. NPDC057654]|uniref:hypothetical protein n=1 Tax=Streptomyces sp. NPDC057654 TaxID=3346196 RepID=UPI0036810BCC